MYRIRVNFIYWFDSKSTVCRIGNDSKYMDNIIKNTSTAKYVNLCFINNNTHMTLLIKMHRNRIINSQVLSCGMLFNDCKYCIITEMSYIKTNIRFMRVITNDIDFILLQFPLFLLSRNMSIVLPDSHPPMRLLHQIGAFL